MFNKKLTVAVAGFAFLLAGCSNSNNSADNKPFSAHNTTGTKVFKQEITGNSNKGSKVYYQVANNPKQSVTVKNDKYTISLPAATKKRQVKVSQSKALKKPIKVTVQKPKKILSLQDFANNFNNSKQLQAKMAAKLPKLNQPMELLFSPTTTYKMLSDGTNLYRVALTFNDYKSNEVKANVNAFASGLKIKRSDLNNLVKKAKSNKGQQQNQKLNHYQVTAVVQGKKLSIGVLK